MFRFSFPGSLLLGEVRLPLECQGALSLIVRQGQGKEDLGQPHCCSSLESRVRGQLRVHSEGFKPGTLRRNDQAVWIH